TEAERSRKSPTLTSAYLQQEGRAMATLDRQIPSPDTFLCEPWSSFVSAAKLRFVDSKFAGKNGPLPCRARAVEMFVYGQFPTMEDFSLVVCHVCNKVVTPQGILTHYGKTHAVPSQAIVVHLSKIHTHILMCLQLSHKQSKHYHPHTYTYKAN
uniref:Ataxin 7 like 1 n=1 Tax=Echeneis naucrates TaxID=173247 RepID=A0A665TB46_ECHNA